MRIEHYWFTIPLRLRSLFRRGKLEQELEEEIQFHLDHRIAEGIAMGLTPAEARLAALRAMDGLDRHKESMRDMRHAHWWTDFADDVRYAARTLRRAPGLAACVAATLALGIGATSTTFSMVDGLLLRPYPAPDPGAIVTLVSTSRETAYGDFSYREYQDIRRSSKSYDGVIANGGLTAVALRVEAGASPRVRTGMLVSGNYFRVLGVEPRLGRGFREDEDQAAGRDAVVVLAWEFWKQELGSDPAVLGKTFRLNGRDFQVIGVAPESFPGMQIFSNPDLYVPLAMAPVFATNQQKNFFEDRDARDLSVKGRLKRGFGVGQARRELALLTQNFAREYPDLYRDRGAAVRTAFEMRTRNDDRESPWAFIVVFAILSLAVLSVACANAAGLLLTRARTRHREIAIRLAIGAGRFRLLRLLLTETLLLACAGGLGGVAIGYAGIQFFATFKIPAELPVKPPFQMDTRVLVASVALSLLSALLCGLAPALEGARADLLSGLKSAEADAPGRRRLWGRNALVVAQVAASLMLLSAALLMVRGFRHGLSEGVGFTTHDVLMASFDPRLLQYSPAQTRQFYERVGESARQLAGVRSAAFTKSPPLGLEAMERAFFVPDGFEMPRDRQNFNCPMDTVDEGFFETTSIPIVQGRAFLKSDAAGEPAVAIVNEQFAKHYWPGEAAVGKRIRLESRSGPAVEIVGVAKTVKYRSTTEKPKDFVYFPLAQRPGPAMTLLLRSGGDPLLLATPLRELVRSVDANMPLLQVRSYEELYRYNAVEGPGVAIEFVSAMGAAGMLLSIAGLYGVVAYNVSRRTREIGIRMAIGAGPGDVLRLVMGKGIALVAVGTAIGLLLGFGVERLMQAMIFNLGGTDILAYAAMAPVMFGATMLAAYLPARRATRIAPTEALRID